MKILIVCFLMFTTSLSNLFSQINLVQNPGMEDFMECPDEYSCIGMDAEIFYWVDKWMSPTYATPDYFNVCSVEHVGIPASDMADYQPARSGEAYCGIILFTLEVENYREYIQVELSGQGLKEGVCYEVEFYVNPGYNVEGYPSLYLTTDKIGAYFSIDRLFDFGTYVSLPVTPQIQNPAGQFFNDTSSWQIVSGIYEATGGEKWLTIGNFYNNASTDLEMVVGDTIEDEFKTAYVFIEDVSVTACFEDSTTFIQNNN
ncbi:MAG: hypothetical protein ACHQFW_06660, partial [Chitinophagales bacterium]